MPEEIILTGGRVTQEVVRKGDRVYRTMGPNASFVHSVLIYLAERDLNCVPRYIGVEDGGRREILSYIAGSVPSNLGVFTLEQCCQATQIIKELHICLSEYPGCPQGQTVCHNDLSPCNFVFVDGKPIAVIDWDAAAMGHPLDDLAYAIWMWLDIGNEENDPVFVRSRMSDMLNIYEVPSSERVSVYTRTLRRMDRVAESIFPAQEQTIATQSWAIQCKTWFQKFWRDFM